LLFVGATSEPVGLIEVRAHRYGIGDAIEFFSKKIDPTPLALYVSSRHCEPIQRSEDEP
jgi:hypothetical protein